MPEEGHPGSSGLGVLFYFSLFSLFRVGYSISVKMAEGIKQVMKVIKKEEHRTTGQGRKNRRGRHRVWPYQLVSRGWREMLMEVGSCPRGQLWEQYNSDFLFS